MGVRKSVPGARRSLGQGYLPAEGARGVFIPTDNDRDYWFLRSLSTDGLRRVMGQLSPAKKKNGGKLVINERKRPEITGFYLHIELSSAHRNKPGKKIRAAYPCLSIMRFLYLLSARQHLKDAFRHKRKQGLHHRRSARTSLLDCLHF